VCLAGRRPGSSAELVGQKGATGAASSLWPRMASVGDTRGATGVDPPSTGAPKTTCSISSASSGMTTPPNRHSTGSPSSTANSPKPVAARRRGPKARPCLPRARCALPTDGRPARRLRAAYHSGPCRRGRPLDDAALSRHDASQGPASARMGRALFPPVGQLSPCGSSDRSACGISLRSAEVATWY
jgi:hypothetical protein